MYDIENLSQKTNMFENILTNSTGSTKIKAGIFFLD